MTHKGSSATAPRQADALFDQSMDILTRHMQRMGLQPELPGRLLMKHPPPPPPPPPPCPGSQDVPFLPRQLARSDTMQCIVSMCPYA